MSTRSLASESKDDSRKRKVEEAPVGQPRAKRVKKTKYSKPPYKNSVPLDPKLKSAYVNNDNYDGNSTFVAQDWQKAAGCDAKTAQRVLMHTFKLLYEADNRDNFIGNAEHQPLPYLWGYIKEMMTNDRLDMKFDRAFDFGYGADQRARVLEDVD